MFAGSPAPAPAPLVSPQPTPGQSSIPSKRLHEEVDDVTSTERRRTRREKRRGAMFKLNLNRTIRCPMGATGVPCKRAADVFSRQELLDHLYAHVAEPSTRCKVLTTNREDAHDAYVRYKHHTVPFTKKELSRMRQEIYAVLGDDEAFSAYLWETVLSEEPFPPTT